MTNLLLLVLPVVLMQGHAGQGRIDSPHWPERYQAFTRLSAQLTAHPANKQKLIQLLRRESRLVQSTLETSDGKIGVSSAFGEEFGEYYSMLLEKVFEFGKADGDADALRAVAAGAYDPRSVLARELDRYWQVTTPVFLEFGPEAGAGITFADALVMMGRILGAHREELDRATVRRMEERLMQGLLHPQFTIRRAACHAAGDAKFLAALPVLRRIAREDPVHHEGRAGRPVYPGREVAAEVLRRLEKEPD